MEVSIRHICDRQGLLQSARARQLGLEEYVSDRLDMYWVKVTAQGKGAGYWHFCVEPARDGTWRLAYQNYEDIPLNEKAWAMARLMFEGSEEEVNQRRWIGALEAGGYFADGRYPGANTEVCRHCAGRFKAGTTHEHYQSEDRVLEHSYRLHRAQLALGLEPRWLPGTGDVPSLEELGELP